MHLYRISPFVKVVILISLAVTTTAGQGFTRDRKDIFLRDPYVLVDNKSGKFYMYGTCTFNGQYGFDVYETDDPTLLTWSDPKPAFRRSADFWADRDPWAPEVHFYKGHYYMFATFASGSRCRGTQILKSDSPSGPFTAHSPEPITPPDYNALDGTLYIDKGGNPWMVYCREWVSVGDGEMRAVRLKPDLTGRLEGSEDILLFKASQALWAASLDAERRNWVTDGPHMYRTKDGQLLMVWSSFVPAPHPIGLGYAVGVVWSSSGEIQGPWVHENKPLYYGHAGHGMIFKHPTEGLKLSVHQPNSGGAPYPLFVDVYEVNNRLTTSDPTAPKYVQAYWRFEDGTPNRGMFPSIDILDISGKGNHLRGQDYDTIGKFSAAAQASASRGNFVCYDNSEPSPNVGRLTVTSGPLNSRHLKAWTIEALICPAKLELPQTFISKDGNFGPDKQGALSFGIASDGKLTISFYNNDSKLASIISKTALQTGRWYNVAASSDGKHLRLYIDSSNGKGYMLEDTMELSGENYAIADNNGVWTLGSGMSAGRPIDQFTGLIDEVRISSIALKPEFFLSNNPAQP